MDLCKDFLVYLIQFREKAPTPAAPTLQQARADVLAILDRMEVQTRREPSLALPLQRARYALVALADEVFMNSGWDRSREWGDLTLERQIFQTSRADYHFFELLDQADPNDQEITAVYYLCLALGFTGRFEADDPELQEYKRKLLARLPEDIRPELPGQSSKRKSTRLTLKPLSWPAKWALLGGLALLAVVLLVGAGWLLGPDNFLPHGEKDAQTTRRAAAPLKSAPAAKAETKAEPKQAGPTPAPEPAKAVVKPEKRQLVLVPGRTVTASTAVAQPKPPAAKPKPRAEPAAEKAPAAGSSSPEAKPAAQKAKAEPKPKKPAPKAQPPARAAYQVLVASFVGPKQSGRLAKKLKAMGYPARVELLPRPGKKPWYVVKVIPLKSKAEARRVASAVKRRLGLRGMVRPVQ